MYRIALIVFIGLLVALPASAQSSAVDRPTWSAGDTWTYRQGGKTTTWAVLGATENGYAVQIKSASPEIVHVTRDLLFDKSYYFHPQWPLAVGNQWTFTVEDTAANSVGGTNTYEISDRVAGQESVTVPAGTFQAVHIRGKQCNATQQNRCGDFDVWYAPQVKFTVKISLISSSYWSSVWTRELVSYQVHTP